MEDLEEKWALWMTQEGKIVEDDVEQLFIQNRNIFEIDDGTHAKWVKNANNESSRLGMLLVLTIDEVAELTCAWEDAQDGNMNAGSFVAEWLNHFMAFMDAASDIHSDAEDD